VNLSVLIKEKNTQKNNLNPKQPKNMLLASVSLALLVVYAGVNLLIQTKKEVLGTLYKCTAWFFIIAGFVTLTFTGGAMCFKMAMHMMHGKEMMEGHIGYGGHHMKGYKMDHKNMMKYHHMGMGKNCCMTDDCCRMMSKHDMNMEECKKDTMTYNRK